MASAKADPTGLRVMFNEDIFMRQRFGGISRFFVELVRNLPRFAIDPKVFAPFHANAYLGDLPAQRFVGGIGHQIDNRLQKAAAIRVQPFAAPLAARLCGAQVVHETYYAARRPAPRGVPIVVTMYDMIHELDDSFAGDPVLKLKADAIDRADWITCISENTRQDMIRLFPHSAAKSSTIHLSAQLPDTTGAPSPHDRPYVLYIGERARDYKNFRNLFAAYRNDPAIHGSFDLICIGGGAFTGEERAEIEAAKLGSRVHQLGAHDALLARYYRHAACMVYPSTYEGFGIPPLEAMIAGCPVVVLRAASLPEVCGDAAAYAEDGSPDALGAAMRRILDDETTAERFRQAGFEQAAQFSWERCARETAEVYHRLAEKGVA
ncbi:glycosyltransferase family 1 protein [Croceicoccus sp. YJ47]|uniref:glycosyltransferase family 4 protein n=1 Tax=Croceicoccus sp. YJ47 TaxID=2798724 RepID=UPI001921C103|nr:glycosyltransferase family 1 protein [Croceicoccus sp. YJ47]QQN72999.1 glycosyltransferase family 4 protein [Croceicoccus sp. YJ47]